MIREPQKDKILRSIAVQSVSMVLLALFLLFCQYGRVERNKYKILTDNSLYDKVNPNTASWPSLSRLPGISYKRAQAIIAYREKVQERHPQREAFVNANELDAIAGFGPILVDKICKYLEFK